MKAITKITHGSREYYLIIGKIMNLHDAGKNLKEIAEILGYAPGQVRSWYTHFKHTRNETTIREVTEARVALKNEERKNSDIKKQQSSTRLVPDHVRKMVLCKGIHLELMSDGFMSTNSDWAVHIKDDKFRNDRSLTMRIDENAKQYRLYSFDHDTKERIFKCEGSYVMDENTIDSNATFEHMATLIWTYLKSKPQINEPVISESDIIKIKMFTFTRDVNPNPNETWFISKTDEPEMIVAKLILYHGQCLVKTTPSKDPLVPRYQLDQGVSVIITQTELPAGSINKFNDDQTRLTHFTTITEDLIKHFNLCNPGGDELEEYNRYATHIKDVAKQLNELREQQDRLRRPAITILRSKSLELLNQFETACADLKFIEVSKGEFTSEFIERVNPIVEELAKHHAQYKAFHSPGMGSIIQQDLDQGYNIINKFLKLVREYNLTAALDIVV